MIILIPLPSHLTCAQNVLSVRKQLKIRPGYTPQEDVQRFRSTRQQAIDARALPPGHIPGWVPPSSSSKKPSSSSRGVPGAGDFPSLGGTGAGAGGEGKALSKAQKKNEKRRQKKKETKDDADEPVRDNWDSDEDDKSRVGSGAKSVSATASPAHTQDTPNASEKDKAVLDSADADAVAEKLSKLDVQ